MNFPSAQDEIRERFMEAFSLLNDIRLNSPEPNEPLNNVQKARRGLWLVALYAAFERSSNAIVEAAISEIASHGSKSLECTPIVQSIFHFSKVQAIKDCGLQSILDKSKNLLDAAFSEVVISDLENPLAERLQNVDAGTLKWVAELFGLNFPTLNSADIGRVGTLRERRNAVAHGRESASQVGERYMLSELDNVYNAADRVVTAFLLAMRDHCTAKRYLRVA